MKKTISILTAALLLVSLCACGNSAPAATQPPVPETPVPSEAPAESPAAESMGQALLKDFTDRVNADPEIGAEALAKALMDELHHGVTQFQATGMYEGTQHSVLICVVNKAQIAAVNRIVASFSNTFATVNTVEQVLGNFKRLDSHGKLHAPLLDK